MSDASLKDLPYENKYHIVLATICYLLRNEKDIRKKIVCLKLDVNKYQQMYLQSNVAVCPLYKTLPQRRAYTISSNIGGFKLARFMLPVMADGKALTPSTILWDHWEYFAYRTYSAVAQLQYHKGLNLLGIKHTGVENILQPT